MTNSHIFFLQRKNNVKIWVIRNVYIYGSVGLGKTHILNSIGNQLKQLQRRLYTYPLRDLCINFVKSIKTKVYKFKDIFRNADVLILDDIQFISGKDVTQEEEFFYTLMIQ